MALKLYNSLTRKKEVFTPLNDKKVGLYSCGPTVYQFAHIGNLRTYISTDLLRRTLTYLGYEVKHVMNITDVGHLTMEAQDSGEDKIEASAKKTGETAQEIALFYEEAFFADLKKLNILQPDKTPRATEYINQQISLVEQLEKKGYTYTTKDGIYFDTNKLQHYPRLIQQSPEEKETGTRIPENPNKRNPADFALWKFSPEDQQRQLEWESPWGKGFPGWHLECSVMSSHHLDTPFDIHTGGIDHKEVHHPNEIAQTEAAEGNILANYWLHAGFLTVQGNKMAKSEGNIQTLRDLEGQSFDPLDFRLLVLQSHYRHPMHFSMDALQKARQARHNLLKKLQNSPALEDKASSALKRDLATFQEKMENDLNTPEALAVIFNAKEKAHFRPLLQKANRVLGIAREKELTKTAVPEDIQRLVQQRETLRRKGQYEQADKLRAQIEQAGWQVEDAPDGPRLTPKNNNSNIKH